MTIARGHQKHKMNQFRGIRLHSMSASTIVPFICLHTSGPPHINQLLNQSRSDGIRVNAQPFQMMPPALPCNFYSPWTVRASPSSLLRRRRASSTPNGRSVQTPSSPSKTSSSTPERCRPRMCNPSSFLCLMQRGCSEICAPSHTTCKPVKMPASASSRDMVPT